MQQIIRKCCICFLFFPFFIFLQNEDFRKLFLRFEMLVNGSGGVKYFFQRIDNFWEELQDMTAYRKLGFRLAFHLKGSVV